MRSGKVSEAVLQRSVLRPLSLSGVKSEDTAFGVDAQSILSVSERSMFTASVSTTVGGIWDQTPKMAIMGVCNNLAAAGAQAAHLVIDIIFPAAWQEIQLKELVREIAKVSEKQGLTVMGGHTEISSAVLRPVITITGLAFGEDRRQKRLQPEMQLLMTGYAGEAGALILARAKEEILRQRFPLSLVDQVFAREDQILSIEPAVKTARARQEIAVHDISQGGVFGALWEMAQAANTGLEIDLKKIPIRQDTIEICEQFQVNPYQLFSQGAALIGTFDGEELEEILLQQGIPARIIGRVTAGNDRILRNGEEIRYLDKPAQDMLRVMEEQYYDERTDFNFSGKKQ